MRANKEIGIIGGMGPHAGIDLARKILDNTVASTDQEHLDTTLISAPGTIVDRSRFLSGETKTNPAVALLEVAKRLVASGATVAGIPCVTAHHPRIFDELKRLLAEHEVHLELRSIVKETVGMIRHQLPHVRRVAAFSTTMTLKSRLFLDELSANGLEAVIQSEDVQSDCIHASIYHPVWGIKATSNPVSPEAQDRLLQALSSVKAKGAEAVILGCTELPLALDSRHMDGVYLIDPTEALARSLVASVDPDRLLPLPDYALTPVLS